MIVELGPIYQTSKKAFVMRRVGTVWLLVNPQRDFPDDEWKEYLDMHAQAVGTTSGPQHVLNHSLTHGPNTKQRKVSTEYREKSRFDDIKAMALITDSMLARGTITAYQWLFKGGFEIKTYASKQIEVASAWVGGMASVPPEVLMRSLKEQCEIAGAKFSD